MAHSLSGSICGVLQQMVLDRSSVVAITYTIHGAWPDFLYFDNYQLSPIANVRSLGQMLNINLISHHSVGYIIASPILVLWYVQYTSP